MRKFGLLIMLVCGLHCAKAQGNDTLIRGNGYVIFKGDTLNRYNNKGEREGRWIEWDSSMVVRMSISTACSFGANRTSTTTYTSDTSYLYIVRATGQYSSNKKDSVWINYTRKSNIDKKVVYKKGIGTDVIIYFSDGSIQLQGTVQEGTRKVDCVFYDKEGNVIGRGERDLDFLLEI